MRNLINEYLKYKARYISAEQLRRDEVILSDFEAFCGREKPVAPAGVWVVDRDITGFACGISRNGYRMLQLNPGTERNEKKAQEVVNELNRHADEQGGENTTNRPMTDKEKEASFSDSLSKWQKSEQGADKGEGLSVDQRVREKELIETLKIIKSLLDVRGTWAEGISKSIAETLSRYTATKGGEL